MTNDLKRTGSCLCKAVKYEVELNSTHVHICHCNICQNWGGGPALTINHTGNMKVQGNDNIKWYSSSEWAQRGFCRTCGTHIAFKTNDGSYHGITVGALDSQENLVIGSHIFIDKKPAYFDFKDDAPRITEEQFLQQFEDKE